MIGNTTRSPLAIVAAPAPTPTPADKAVQPDVAAHPFAEMLRQNRLAEAPAAPGPKAAASTDSKPASKTPDADDGASPATPVTPSASRDAAQAKARAATAPHTPARSTVPSARAATAIDGTHDGRDEDAASTSASSDASSTATPATNSPPALASRGDAAPDERAYGSALNASAANGAQASTAAVLDGSARAGSSASNADTRRDVVATTADAAPRTAEKTSDSRLRDAAPSFADALAEGKTSHRADASPAAGHSHAAVAAAPALAEPTRTAAPAADTPIATSTVPVPVESPDFAAAFGLQVSTLARDGVQRAELHLNPADMGPVSIQITLDGTQARVDFGADVATTRHAIEAGLPELASALRDAGFTLAGGGVAQHSRPNGGQGDDAGSGEAGSRRNASATVAHLDVVAQRATRRAVAGGVDLYA